MKGRKTARPASPSSQESKMKKDPFARSSEEMKTTTGERSLDIGQSGQFAPGGYYNQQGVNAPKRRSIDDEIVPPRCT
jgi:hypothetical protein